MESTERKSRAGVYLDNTFSQDQPFRLGSRKPLRFPIRFNCLRQPVLKRRLYFEAEERVAVLSRARRESRRPLLRAPAARTRKPAHPPIPVAVEPFILQCAPAMWD